MPKYTYNGKTISSDVPLSEADLEEAFGLATNNPTAKTTTFSDDVNSLKEKIKQLRPETTMAGGVRGLKDVVDAGAQMLPRGLQQVTSLFGAKPNTLSDWFGSEAQRVDAMVKADEEAYQNSRGDRKGAFDLPRVAGNVISPAAPVNAVLSKATPAVKAAVSGTVGGALTPVYENTEDFGNEKAKQMLLGGAMGYGGSKLMSAAGHVLSPQVSAAEQQMRDMGVRMTPGEMAGGLGQRVEGYAQNIPTVGGAIKKARDRALEDWNKGVINKSLKKIGEELPEGVVGRDAVNDAATKISNKYDDVLSKMSYTLDTQASSDILNALNKAKLTGASQREQAVKILQENLFGRFDTTQLDGKALKMVESDLRTIANNYAASNTVADKEVGQAIQEALKAFKNTVSKQNPKFSSELRRIDSAYGDLDIIKRAAANTAAQEGIFSPKQYQQAVRQADASRRKSGFAKGTARGVKEADAALEALGNYQTTNGINNIALGSGLGGLAYGAANFPMATLFGIGGVNALYSEPGLKLADKLMRERSDASKAVGNYLIKNSPVIGGLFGNAAVQEYNREDRK